MRLLKLSLLYFKGIREFTLEPNGEDIDIFGRNSTGKTTLFDAFLWLLFNKDSQGQTDFDIKTLDAEGKPIHGLTHQVEAVLDLGIGEGKTLTLKKALTEKWTKKRGSSESVFTGHETDYWIDELPVKKGQYDSAIKALVDEQVFRLLTNPKYFNEILPWKDRRAILMRVCGEPAIPEVVAGDKGLADLPSILKNHTPEDYRKIVKDKQSAVQRQLADIPVRIDEISRRLSAEGDLPIAEYDKRLAEARQKRAGLAGEVKELEAGGGVVQSQVELRQLESRIADLDMQHRAGISNQTRDLSKADFEIGKRIWDAAEMVRQWERELAGADQTIKTENVAMEKLRDDWVKRKAQVFTSDETCFTCGQPLPDHMKEEAREKANELKAEDLKELEKEAQVRADRISEASEVKKRLTKMVTDKTAEKQTLTAEQLTIREKLEALSRRGQEPSPDPQRVELANQAEALRAEVSRLLSGGLPDVTNLKADMAKLDADIASIEHAIAEADMRERSLARVEILKDEERKLAAELTRLDREMLLLENFTVRKVGMMEGKINSAFQHARFRLFNVQINGGIEEVCETTYLGVPYSSLNNGARINIGLDIINTLSRVYGVTAPVFADNAEAVVRLLPTEAQQIRLYVSAAHPTLTVVTKTKKEVAP